jgi:hypothetical protein
MSSLKVLRRMAHARAVETGQSDSVDACSVRVIRDDRISNAGVTARATGGGLSHYTRRQRQGTSGGRFPACDDGPLSGDLPPAGAREGLHQSGFATACGKR